MSALGVALCLRGHGESPADLERGISCLRLALDVRTPDWDARGWGRVNSNLAAALLATMKDGEGRTSLALAESHLASAGEMLTAETPDRWAMLQVTRARAALRHEEVNTANEEEITAALEPALANAAAYLPPDLVLLGLEQLAELHQRLAGKDASSPHRMWGAV